MIEEALIGHLLSDGGVTALVGNRVFPGRRQQASALPALVVTRIDGAPEYADEGPLGFGESRIQVDAYGRTYADAKGAARAAKARLIDVKTTLGGVAFLATYLDAERDFPEGGSNTSEYLFRTSLDITVWHETE